MTIVGPSDYVPRAMIAVLSASLHMKFNLASGIITELPDSARSKTFKDLTRIASIGESFRPRSVAAQYTCGVKLMSEIARYGSDSSVTRTKPLLSLLASDETGRSDLNFRREAFKGTLTFSIQDLLAYVGVIDRLGNKGLISSDSVLTGMESVRKKLLAEASPR